MPVELGAPADPRRSYTAALDWLHRSTTTPGRRIGRWRTTSSSRRRRRQPGTCARLAARSAQPARHRGHALERLQPIHDPVDRPGTARLRRRRIHPGNVGIGAARGELYLKALELLGAPELTSATPGLLRPHRPDHPRHRRSGLGDRCSRRCTASSWISGPSAICCRRPSRRSKRSAVRRRPGARVAAARRIALEARDADMASLDEVVASDADRRSGPRRSPRSPTPTYSRRVRDLPGTGEGGHAASRATTAWPDAQPAWATPDDIGPKLDVAKMDLGDGFRGGYFIHPSFAFCVAPNPQLTALRSHAEVDLLEDPDLPQHRWGRDPAGPYALAGRQRADFERVAARRRPAASFRPSPIGTRRSPNAPSSSSGSPPRSRRRCSGPSNVATPPRTTSCGHARTSSSPRRAFGSRTSSSTRPATARTWPTCSTPVRRCRTTGRERCTPTRT